MPDIEFSTRGAEKIVDAHEKINKAVDQTKQNYKLTAQEAQQLGRIERQVYRDTETALEQYNRKMAEARKALAGNRDETERLQRLEQQLAMQFAKTAGEAEKAHLKTKVAAGKATDEEKKLLAAVQETERSLSNSGTAFTAAFSPARLAGVAAGFVGVQQIVGAITRELHAQQELVDKRNATQLTVGESRNVLLRNLVGSSPDDIAKMQGAASSIASETGVSEVAVNNALASAVSATGGRNDLAIELTRYAAKFLPDRPAEIGDFAGSLGDLTRVTNSNDPVVQLGLLAKIGQLSRVTNPKLIADNAAPAMIGTMPFGGDASSSGALFAALTLGGGEKMGASTGTAVISLAQQLSEASQGKGAFGKEFKPGEIAGSNLIERIRSLQSNPELAQRFIDAGSFEKKAIGPITQLLVDPKSKVREDFENSLKQIPNEAGLRAAGKEALGIFQYNTLEGTAQRGRALQSGLEQLQTRKPSDTFDSKELEALRAALLETGSSDTGARIAEMIGRVKGGGTVKSREVENILHYRIGELEHPTISLPPVGDGDWGSTMERAPTMAEQQSAQILREMLEQLRQSNRAMEENNRRLGQIQARRGGMLAGSD